MAKFWRRANFFERDLQSVGGKNVSVDMNFDEDEDEDEGVITSANNVVVRTIEVSTLHKGNSIATARKLRVEPLPTNCLTAEVDGQSVAYVRSKMTRLTQDPATLGGKIALNIHRMQSSKRTKSNRGNGKKISGMRFAAKNVEKYGDKVHENMVVCEIYRSAYGSQWGMGDDDGDENGSLAEIVFHFGEENMKDRTPHQWSIENKGHQGQNKKGGAPVGEHWFGRKSSIDCSDFHKQFFLK